MPVEWFGDDLLKRIREETPEGLFEAGEKLVEAAASKAPRRTGELAESGYVVSENKSTYRKDKSYRKELKPKKGEVIVAFAAFYARFVEYGTKNKAARPFLRPALDELKGRLGADFAKRLQLKIK